MLPCRHWCDQADELSRYGWLLHDGRDFGMQSLEDKHVTLQTMFVKQQGGQHGGEWSARINVLPKVRQYYHFLLFILPLVLSCLLSPPKNKTTI